MIRARDVRLTKRSFTIEQLPHGVVIRFHVSPCSKDISNIPTSISTDSKKLAAAIPRYSRR